MLTMETLLLALLIPTDTNAVLIRRYGAADDCAHHVQIEEDRLRTQYPAAMARCFKVTFAPVTSPRPKPRDE